MRAALRMCTYAVRIRMSYTNMARKNDFQIAIRADTVTIHERLKSSFTKLGRGLLS